MKVDGWNLNLRQIITTFMTKRTMLRMKKKHPIAYRPWKSQGTASGVSMSATGHSNRMLRLTVVHNICNSSSSHLSRASVKSSSIDLAEEIAYRHSKPRPSKMLYPLPKMQMIRLMSLLPRQFRRHRRRRSVMVLDAVRNHLARRLPQRSPCGRRRGLLRRKVAMV